MAQRHALVLVFLLGTVLSCHELPAAGPLVPFNLCLTDMGPAQQLRSLSSMGYCSVVLGGLNEGELGAFATLPQVANGSFRITSALWWYRWNEAIDTAWLDRVLERAASLGMSIWIVADWDGSVGKDEALETTFRNFSLIAAHCKAKGVEMVLYPHVGCVFETAEEALVLQERLARAGYPDVRISLHLCHELKRNNRDRLEEIVRKVAPALALVSINGANADTYTDYDHEYWSTAIMALDEGSLDIRPVLGVLRDVGYKGPMVLHTYGLSSPAHTDYTRHLERSLARWKQLSKP